MNTLDRINAVSPDIYVVHPEGFEDAVIGTLPDDDFGEILVLSVSKCVDILCRDMPREQALEWFEYNIRGSIRGCKYLNDTY